MHSLFKKTFSFFEEALAHGTFLAVAQSRKLLEFLPLRRG